MKKVKDTNPKLNWLLGTLLMVPAILALQFTDLSVYADPSVNKFVLENIGTAFLLVFVVCTLLLHAKQKGRYFPFINKQERSLLDERQVRVRQRVYERSYLALAISLVLVMWLFHTNDPRMQLIVWWVFGIGFFAMPAIVAARQKDS